MKTATAYRNNLPARTAVRYPNAANRRQLVNKFVDLLLASAIGMGLAASILFLAVLA